MTGADVRPEVRELRREVRRLKRGLGLLAVALLAVPFLALRRGAEDVLRVRGIVVEDDQGRERILIGAPIPAAAHRIRTDPDRARATFGRRYPDFDWYADLEHSTNGVLVLDEEGHDRLVIGDPTPDPSFGRRVAPGTGLAVNDENGFERSGWGYFEELGMVGLGLDHPSGEGLNLVLRSGDAVGVLLRTQDGSRTIFLGDAAASTLGMTAPVRGLAVIDRSGARVDLDGSAPRIELRAPDGSRLELEPGDD